MIDFKEVVKEVEEEYNNLISERIELNRKKQDASEEDKETIEVLLKENSKKLHDILFNKATEMWFEKKAEERDLIEKALKGRSR